MIKSQGIVAGRHIQYSNNNYTNSTFDLLIKKICIYIYTYMYIQIYTIK